MQALWASPFWKGLPSRRNLPMKPVSRIPLAALLAGAFTVTLLTTSARGDVIMDWNAKADAIGIEKQVPNAPNARGQAMLHVAMFEAVNAIDKRYAPYKFTLIADRAASKEAAAASAAHDVLWRFTPTRSPTLMPRLLHRFQELPNLTQSHGELNLAREPLPRSSRCAPRTAATRRKAIGLIQHQASTYRPRRRSNPPAHN